MNPVIINIKTNKDLKESAQKTANNLGISLSSVINNYLKTFIVEKRVVFDSALMPNKATQILLNKAMQNIKAKKNLSKSFSNVDDFINDLNS
ncbi:hypothetical protein A3J61_02580 [Candidatus Nomurabacteria bacterium RIFCSPHIGHO2_02_FULL_38_15]|uniref:Damage-inducible protein J n=1 Tax=Candidatus Nomurabacteria bacterium RIFCSPHIGHO2_02_FULL_38_15 TaxID=1801752 RepID=A0A1F6VQ75_9BACT|nr:MAG: hypothetical protein A3J61_02580 [Candidatus Nomurabacteria bacterium RIFCSPHIGHO2_02_FULL_38_15]